MSKPGSNNVFGIIGYYTQQDGLGNCGDYKRTREMLRVNYNKTDCGGKIRDFYIGFMVQIQEQYSSEVKFLCECFKKHNYAPGNIVGIWSHY